MGAALAATLAILSAAAQAETRALRLSLGSCALPEAKLGELRSVFWDVHQHTETCVSLVPDPAAPGLELTFSFTHVGREWKAPPQVVLLRAQLPPFAMIVTPSLTVVLDEKETLDLTAPGREYHVVFPALCPPDAGCGFTGVDAAIPASVFRRIASAKTVRITAFGTATTLSPAARANLAALAARLGPEG